METFASTPQEQQYIQKRFFESLTEPTFGRDGLRNKRLLSGMVQCLLLDRIFKNWQTALHPRAAQQHGSHEALRDP